MERTRLPDAINCSVSKNFTQVPNRLLRNPDITHKAKSILCLLLSNKEGWTSYMASLCKMSKEGESAIRSALKELEEHGYLLRLKYRDRNKRWVGSFWAYTDTPWEFYLKDHLTALKRMGFQLDSSPFLNTEDPEIENLILENQGLLKTEIEGNQGVRKEGVLENSEIENQRLIIRNRKNKEKKDVKAIYEKFLDYLPPSYQQHDQFMRAVHDFILHRKQIKKPLTPIALKRLGRKLRKYDLPTCTEALSLSVENGWTGVFPESIKKSGSNNESGSHHFQSALTYPEGEPFDPTSDD